MTTAIDDHDDGSYTLILRSKYSGTSEVHVTIDGVHVHGSPAQMKLTSTQPDLAQTTCSGEGLAKANAGKASTFRIHFVDEHGNTATPGEGLQAGNSPPRGYLTPLLPLPPLQLASKSRSRPPLMPPSFRSQVGMALVPETLTPLDNAGKKDKGVRDGVSTKKAVNCDELTSHALESSWVAEGELEVNHPAHPPDCLLVASGSSPDCLVLTV